MFSMEFTSRQPLREPWTRERLIHERAIAIGSSIDLSTQHSYTSHLQSYLTFCKIHHFPVDPTPDTLSFFTVYMCHHIKPSSVDSYLSGICNQLEPFFPNVRAARKSPLVSRTLAGCKRTLGTAVVRKRPLGTEDLQKCLLAFPATSYDNLLFRALLVAGFLGLHRLGELVRPSKGDIWRKTIPRTSASLDPTHRRCQYRLPTSKTDHIFEGCVILLGEHIDGLPSFDIFANYLIARDHLFPLSPPLWIASSGDVPSREWFLSRLNSVLNDPAVGEHSLRAGGATFFASLGWPDDRIQQLGRWKSDAFRIYIRKNPIFFNALMLGRAMRF